jgi:hypothetical protein
MMSVFIIVYGGRCSSDVPWIFNTATNRWSSLTSARLQRQESETPMPRWGHGCALLPAAEKDSPFAYILAVFGGIGLNSVMHSFFLLFEVRKHLNVLIFFFPEFSSG